MAELEIHHEGGHGSDPMGKKVGVLAAVFAVALAVVTILSHRAHTDAVMKKADENDKWSYYQSKKMKLHNAELGHTLVAVLAQKNEASEKALEAFHKDKEKYEADSEKIKVEAEHLEKEVEIVEKKAFYFDMGEGLLEIALVMSSLYFISKSKLFPLVGVLSGLAGATSAIMAALVQ
jgi:hypothetical protein